MLPAIDVVVPCYRYGRFLPQCVNSVLDQDGVRPRVLIIDDASPDASPEIAKNLAGIHENVFCRLHEVNHGHIRTYNEGIEWAEHQYFLLLSADDYLLPGALSRATRVMDCHADVGLVFGSAVEIFDNGIHRPVRPLHPPGKMEIFPGEKFVRIMGATNIVPTATAVIRTDLQKRIGGYRIELPHAGDYEMWLRIAAEAAVGFINADQAAYRRHAANMSNAYYDSHVLRDLQERLAALSIFFDSAALKFGSYSALRRQLLNDLARQSMDKALVAFDVGDDALADSIAEFAIRCAPGVRTSPGWAKFLGRRVLGRRAWQIISAARHRLA